MEPTHLDSSARARDEAPLGVWRRGFLTALAETGNATAAARCAGVARSTPYDAAKRDPSFAQEWEEAIEEATDALEIQARKRAMGENISYRFTKTGEPILHPITGEPYYEHVSSDALLTLLLKAHRPDKYKDRSAVETTAAPAPKYDLSRLSPVELTQLEALTRAATPPALPA